MEPHGTAQESSADRELSTGRVLDAPRERVFAAFTDPERLARWWGPKGFRSTFQVFEPRPGGAWRFVMHGPDGGNFPNESIFEELVWPERIVIRHASAPRFRLHVTFADAGVRTRVGWRQVFDTAEECDRVRAVAVPANEENLDRLSAELAQRS
jgi:uncharacterized protein YndB with AHSA1/START domain